MNDLQYMRRAERLAEKALGETTPNPIVGAVIVRDGKIIGEGFHSKAGMPHAEIEALNSVKDHSLLHGATIYVTLEPCSSWGRTPPCTEAVLKSGIARVVIGCSDPNPKHAGAAVRIFRNAGLEVTEKIDEVRCRLLNEAFFKWITTRKPFVVLKMASTLDGKIATESGLSKWITGAVARRRVQRLRQWADAIIVGGGTFRTDNPKLTVRDKDERDIKTPFRFVVSGRKDMIIPSGWERVELKTAGDWDLFLKKLGERPVMSVLIEGGGELAASALRVGAVDKIEFHYAPKILCGRNSRPVAGGDNPETLDDAFRVREWELRKLGNDFSLTGYVEKKESLKCSRD